jgi:acetate kinase
MHEPVLVINAGSSSLKFSVFERGNGDVLVTKLQGQVEGIGASPHLKVSAAGGKTLTDEAIGSGSLEDAFAAVQKWLADHLKSAAPIDAVGHRIVHGGSRYCEPVRIDSQVLAGLTEWIPAAPLHQPHQIAAIRAVAKAAPHARQVACFDTAFHANEPALAREYGLPREFAARGIRRYGFHGLSYEYIVSTLPDVAPAVADRRVVVAHLGNGASLCAIAHGRSVATTMGFTPLDGLLMGTRCGALDPGVVLYLLQHEKMSPSKIEQLLYERSGLLGVSGVASDMRALLKSPEQSAREAVELFVYRVSRELGSLVAALGGLDALVFTGGIGEHAAEIRARVCTGATWLGVALDAAANQRGGPRISTADSAVSAWVIPTDENLMVARHTRRVLASGAPT